MKTEKEMREEAPPWPKSFKAMTNYIRALATQEHDYGTAVYAMSLAALAAFNFLGSKLGATGFQAGCADFEFLRRTRRVEGPMMLVRLEACLDPTTDVHGRVHNFLYGLPAQDWLRTAALKRLEQHPDAAPIVLAHWRQLARIEVTEKGDKNGN